MLWLLLLLLRVRGMRRELWLLLHGVKLRALGLQALFGESKQASSRFEFASVEISWTPVLVLVVVVIVVVNEGPVDGVQDLFDFPKCRTVAAAFSHTSTVTP
jgi:hypothetical protein